MEVWFHELLWALNFAVECRIRFCEWGAASFKIHCCELTFLSFYAGKKTDWCFICALQEHAVKVKQRIPFSPSGILSHLRSIARGLNYGNQEDAHEFMRLDLFISPFCCLKLTMDLFLSILSWSSSENSLFYSSTRSDRLHFVIFFEHVVLDYKKKVYFTLLCD